MSQIIYQDGPYQIVRTPTGARLQNGAQRQELPLRSPAPEIPAAFLRSIRTAGHDPSQYFFVGTPKHGGLLRIAALSAWEAAVEADRAARKAAPKPEPVPPAPLSLGEEMERLFSGQSGECRRSRSAEVGGAEAKPGAKERAAAEARRIAAEESE